MMPECFYSFRAIRLFFGRSVAKQLEAAGHETLKINFCSGDALLWWGLKSYNYRLPFSSWKNTFDLLSRNMV